MYSTGTRVCAVLIFSVTCLVHVASGQGITSCKLFEEREGLLVMEAESVLATDSWTLQNELAGASGNAYHEWKHGDNDQGIDAAGTGILTYTFNITLAGEYRFLLRSSSPDNTEHNDVWVRFPDNSATGIRQTGQGTINIDPNSWFKVYQNTSSQEWKWDARTVDFDPHSIYVNIEEPGAYSVALSGRSTLFKIDRLVLFHEQVTFTEATRITNVESTCTEIETVSLRAPDEPEELQPGIHYSYYEGNWSNLPDFSTLSPLESGIVNAFDISSPLTEDYFGFLFRGFVHVPVDGLYTFFTVSNAGSQLYIGDELVVDNDGAHATRERRGSIGLAAGLHKISVLFFEDFWNQSLTVSWIVPGQGRRILGEGDLFYDLYDHPPADYVRFEGIVDPSGVALNWETASELNNAGFEIERRYDTPTDSTAFVSIAFVDGSGTSTINKKYAYIDSSIPVVASVAYYRIKQATFSGAFTYSDIVSVVLPAPEKVALYPNYPNPFSQATTFAFDLNKESPVRLALYNASGQLVDLLLNDMRPAGRNEITVTLPPSLTSGLYIYRLETDEETHSGKMTLIR